MDTLETYKPNHEVAFVTLLYGNLPYFADALVLGASLRPLRQRADIVLMLGGGVSVEVVTALKASGVFTHIIDLPDLHVHGTHIGAKNRWNKSIFKKLFAWRLTRYRKVMFVDSDVLVLKPKADQFFLLFDEFRHTDLPAACIMGSRMLTHHVAVDVVQGSPRDSKVIAGLMLVTPSSQVFRQMRQSLTEPSVHAGKFFTNHEEIFLGTFFKRWMTIHIKYQFSPLGLFCYLKQYYLRVEPDEIVSFHFSGYKAHSFLKNSGYIEDDMKRYYQVATEPLCQSIRAGMERWLRIGKKVERRVYKRTGRRLTDIGDWNKKMSSKHVT